MEALVSVVESLYQGLGLEGGANVGDVWGLIASSFIFLTTILTFVKASGTEKSTPQIEQEKVEAPVAEEKKVEQPKAPEVPAAPKGPSWAQRLAKGLGKSRQEVWSKLGSLLSGNKLSDDILEEVEEILYSADIGPKAVSEILEILETKAKEVEITEENFKALISEYLTGKLGEFQKNIDPDLHSFKNSTGKTKTIMIVGVNGAGKTTTIGKIASRLTTSGSKVVVGAGDTFRAAAVDQLQVWCERAGAQMIRAADGANPSGVAYETLQMALNENADFCLLDTAGRLQNNKNLMQELSKIKNVLKKLDPEAPHETWLVIDAITGQNALSQAREFNEALELSGLIFTKCDGSSKAGSAVSIVNELKVPIIYIGVGEQVEDLNKFELDEYVSALVGNADQQQESVQPTLH
ncbi:MAG: signal recognition particle-docking protein FtsY [Bacteriovoracaceae bacterium]